MNEERRRFVQHLFDRSRAFDRTQDDRLARFRNVEPETAELLGVVARGPGISRVLELGTSNGYSTIWLADAVWDSGGSVLSVDVDRERIGMAREHLREAGLEGVTELRVQDAADTLAASPDAAWDLIFLDAERPAYVAYLGDLVRTLSGGGLLLVDNVLSHEHELVEFTRRIEARRELTQTVLPVGAGIRIAARSRGR